MKYALFLGCTVPTRGINYDVATRSVAKELGIEFWDSTDFVCCGYPLHSMDHNTYLALGARNICIAEEAGLDLVTVCNACTAALTKINMTLKENDSEREEINKILKSTGHEFKGSVNIKHFSRILFEDVGIDKIKEKINKPLKKIKIAPHNGCHYLKPSEIYDSFDNPIRPTTLKKLIKATGANVVNYENEKQCCGGGILAVEESTSMKMAGKKLENIQKAGADAMVLQCPFCSIMYDEYQATILETMEKDNGEEEPTKIPVLYYPQLLGLAMGLDPKTELGLKKNTVKTKNLINMINEEGNGVGEHE
jgi:heterodisulfide reductase subunit B